ncbi:MAG: glycosyl transferase group 1 [Herminiimonas sp.]|nr:glycosyl transferase group 1 [Herminiimonas sp.]
MRTASNRKVVISVNTAWNMHNFRAGLIRALLEKGYEVLALAPDDEYRPLLQDMGCRFITMPMDTNGTNPVTDLLLLTRYLRVLRRERPFLYLGYTIKPNIYGSLAAHALGIPVINTISGLGAAFIRDNLVTRIVRQLYRLSLRRSRRVYFQNPDDKALFVSGGLIRPDAAYPIAGSGIDLTRYLPAEMESVDGRAFRFLLVARMLKDKGIEEFAEAASIVRRQCPDTVFLLLGFSGAGNPNAVSLERIKAWEAQGTVQYLGKTDDVRPHLAGADCVVLPSYREGIPRTLLEAAAMARPIVATDVVGCRSVVDDQVNGLLCRARDSRDLAEKMTEMTRLSPARRMEMGRAGRRKVAVEFDERTVVCAYLDVVGEIDREAQDAGKRSHWRAGRLRNLGRD